MRCCALLLLAAACQLPHETGDFSLSIQVHAGTLGPLDGVLVLASDTPIEVGGELPTAPITPAMLAANIPAPSDVQIWGRSDDSFGMLAWPAGATVATFGSQGAEYAAFDTYGLVVGWRSQNGQRVFGVAEIAPGSVAPSNDRDTVLDVTLSAEPDVELWGHECVRRVVGAQTRYVVAIGDYDCDGLYGSADCKPTTFCAPSTSCPCN